MRNPVAGLLLGIFFGCIGVDRFYKGDWVLGIIKFIVFMVGLVTLSFFIGIPILLLLGLWCFIDFFLVWKGISASNLRIKTMQKTGGGIVD